jgi:hypothetical protein
MPYRDDFDAAVRECESLQAENTRLKRKLDAEIERDSFGRWIRSPWKVTTGVGSVFVISFLISVIIDMVMAILAEDPGPEVTRISMGVPFAGPSGVEHAYELRLTRPKKVMFDLSSVSGQADVLVYIRGSSVPLASFANVRNEYDNGSGNEARDIEIPVVMMDLPAGVIRFEVMTDPPGWSGCFCNADGTFVAVVREVVTSEQQGNN